MIKDVIIKKLKHYHDDRGWLCEIFRDDEIDFRPAMSYISMTNPGVVRGPHEHKEQADYFVFIGPGEFVLHLWDNRPDSETYQEKMEIKGGAENPIYAIVPVGVVHGYKCVSDIPAYCINLPDKLYAGKNKEEEVDEIRWENNSESPFVIE
jgi:dTDP-4-dehydrorhamnose 3,5-epimerase